MTADAVATDEAVLAGGIESVVFFNGRLLTGEDLTREQRATDTARRRLGRVVGSGVSCGFAVSEASSSTSSTPALVIGSGLAVNRAGVVLELSSSIVLALRRDPAANPGSDLDFSDCVPLQPGTYSSGAGLYLLSVTPVRTGLGRAPVSGLGGSAACNVAYSVEGVKFRLLRIAVPPEAALVPSQLRNRVAGLMAGSGALGRRAFYEDPLAPTPAGHGMLQELWDGGCLTADEVPIALVRWSVEEGLDFVDPWSVRRRFVTPVADDRFPLVVGDAKRATAEALFAQFQDEVTDARLRATPTAPLSVETAATRFGWLPPVGIVPILGSGPAGYVPDGFLGPQGSRSMEMLDAGDLRRLVQDSFDHDPVAVGSDEPFQRYLLYENERAIEAGRSVTRVMVFARRSLRFRGTARYGRARFGRSRFAPSVS